MALQASSVLAKADRARLEQLVSRRVGPDDLDQALERTPDDIRAVLEFEEARASVFPQRCPRHISAAASTRPDATAV
jgi:hypothetical protein